VLKHIEAERASEARRLDRDARPAPGPGTGAGEGPEVPEAIVARRPR
jgi:hypothetical protein